MFFGFLFRVWMLSFFIARGRGTWQGGRGGWLVTVCGHTCGLLHGHLPGSQPCRAGHCCGPVWGVANPQAQCFPSGRVRRSLSHPSLPGLGAGGSRRALGVSSLCPRLHGCREAAVKLWFPRARLHHQSSSSMCAWYGQWGHMCTGVYPLSPGPTRLTPYPVPQPRLGLGVHLCRQPHARPCSPRAASCRARRRCTPARRLRCAARGWWWWCGSWCSRGQPGGMRTVDGRRGERGRCSRAGGWTRLRADQLWGWVCKGLGERPLGAKVLRLPRIPCGQEL